jgi:hypothetical protein
MTLPLFARYPGTAMLPLAGIARTSDPARAALDQRSSRAHDGQTCGSSATISPISVYGGNKVRKLDFLLGEALAEEEAVRHHLRSVRLESCTGYRRALTCAGD